MWGCSTKCQVGRGWEVSRAVYRGSAGQGIGSVACRAVFRDHWLSGNAQGSEGKFMGSAGQCTRNPRTEDGPAGQYTGNHRAEFRGSRAVYMGQKNSVWGQQGSVQGTPGQKTRASRTVYSEPKNRGQGSAGQSTGFRRAVYGVTGWRKGGSREVYRVLPGREQGSAGQRTGVIRGQGKRVSRTVYRGQQGGEQGSLLAERGTGYRRAVYGVRRVEERSQQGNVHGSAGQRTGVIQAKPRGQQGNVKGSAGRRTGVTASRVENRGHCQQGGRQGPLLAKQKTGFTAEVRGHFWLSERQGFCWQAEVEHN